MAIVTTSDGGSAGHPEQTEPGELSRTGAPGPAAARATPCRIALPAKPTSCAVARHFVRATLLGLHWPGDVEAAVLLASELVANVVVEASSPCHLSLCVDGTLVRVEATDGDRGRPFLEQCSAGRGRGLLLVDALANAWGSHVEPEEGRTIWFELSAHAGRSGREGPW